MSLKNSTTKLSTAPQKTPFIVKFSDSEYNALTLKIPRALALADVMTIAENAEGINTERASMGECLAMLWELLNEIDDIWSEATARQAED